MVISRDRFQLALTRLEFPQWALFEALASAFLVSEFGQLRTMAAPSGDGGRDSQLYHPDGELDVAFQYSVTGQWQAKIKATKKRLFEEFPDVRQLIYVTNQSIGAQADKLRRELSKEGLSLDIRDEAWFLERANLDTNRAAAAEQLARAMVDPLLSEKGLTGRGQSDFTRDEAKIALFYLEMQREDEERGKNLTRSSFEALVKAALKGTDRENRIGYDELRRRVGVFLPRHDDAQLKPYIDSAILRLKRGAITEWGREQEYHLSFEEAEKIKDRASRLILMKSALEADVQDILSTTPDTVITDLGKFTRHVQDVIESYFLKRGDEFAKAVNCDGDIALNDYDLRQVISSLNNFGLVSGRNQSEFIRSVVITLLNVPSDATREYLRILSDSYTLFAFLSEAPDVQKATNKLFSHGELWVDTSVLLPIIAESAASPDARPFTSLFGQLKKASAKVYVTPGVIEEVRSHLEICLYRSRSTNWTGGAPYVYSRYIINGGSASKFPAWVETFVGSYDPSRDLVEYFSGFDIQLEEPSYADGVSEEASNNVLSYWQEVQANRRKDKGTYSVTTDMLARHDAENCLTVVSSRKKNSRRSGLGHSCWWLTLDTAAYRMKTSLDGATWKEIGFSPVISLDYLMKYLAFGPARDRITSSESSTSRVFAAALLDTVPSELLEIAEKVREQHEGMPEILVQRRIRDAMDRERERIGALHQGGAEDFDLSAIM